MPIRKLMTFYDFQGLCFGILMASLGVVFLKAAGLVTGQTAGLSVLLSYVSPFRFGEIFFVISLPFFVLSWIKRGPVFTFRTLFAVAGISLTTPFLSTLVIFAHLDPLVAAILAGACSGVGLIALFRHNASAGGLGILALIVEQKTGFKTGWFQMAFDACVFFAACFVLPLTHVFYSFIGAALVNAIIAWNFRIDQARSEPPPEPPSVSS